MSQFVLYVARWQLSTPILWLVLSRLGTGIEATLIANLVGASIFFWVDRLIFRGGIPVMWEVLTAGTCIDCGTAARVRRLVLAPGGRKSATGRYDRRADSQPEYRCPSCSEAKLRELRSSEKVARVNAL